MDFDFIKEKQMNITPSWKEQTEVAVLQEKENLHVLILYNDEVNSFDYVIDCLIEICNHTTEQAEQCTWLVHFKGKCEVKIGNFNQLKKVCTQLLERGLSAEVR